MLLAPTWGQSSIFAKFGGKVIKALLDGGFDVIVRPHPQSFKSEAEMMDKLMSEYPESDRLSWNRDNDNFEVLKKSDILVSDFSGIVFDFTLVYDKPVIYADTKMDYSPYDFWWLDDPVWTFETLPKIGMKLTEENFDSLGDMVKECLSDPRFKAGRDTAREETWANIGEGAKLFADYLIDKYNEVSEKNNEKEKEED